MYLNVINYVPHTQKSRLELNNIRLRTVVCFVTLRKYQHMYNERKM